MQKHNEQEVNMKTILAKVDKILCNYLGLDKAEITPHIVQLKGKQLMIVNTDSFKRHVEKTCISESNLKMMNIENKEKLGLAVGKAIASNLIVSFEEVVIKRDNFHV